MTMEEKLNLVKIMLDIDLEDATNDLTIMTYLTVAEREIVTWRYSYSTDSEVTQVPEEYEITQIEAVVAGYSQRGAETESQHNENGINRTFRYADMLQYIRTNVIPICKII